jgi:hypothetical protein
MLGDTWIIQPSFFIGFIVSNCKTTVNDVLESTRNEKVMSYSKGTTHNLPGGTKENYKNLQSK